MKMMKIDYELHGYPKFVHGPFVSQDEKYIVVQTRDGQIFTICKDTIKEIREYEKKEDSP